MPARIALFVSLFLFGACGESPVTYPPIPEGRGERVYVASYDRTVTVLDHDSGAVLGRIGLERHPHGFAAAPDGGTLYVTAHERGGEVVAIDTRTSRIRWRIPVGRQPQLPVLDGQGTRLFVPDLFDGTVTVIDVTTPKIVETVRITNDDAPVEGLHNAYRSPSGDHVYVTAVMDRLVARVDAATLAVDRLYPLVGPPRPGAVLDGGTRMLLQHSDLHGLMELDLESGTETKCAEWPADLPPLQGSRDAYCHGLAVDATEREVWAASSLEQGLRVLTRPGYETIRKIPLGGDPGWITFSADGQTVYATVRNGNAEGRLAVIDRASGEVRAFVAVGRRPSRVLTIVLP